MDVCIFDYDGTLCARTDSSVTTSVVQLLRILQNDYKLVLATGRPKSLIPSIPEFQWDATVYFNGQLCLSGNHIIHQQMLEYMEWREFCQNALREHVEFLVFSDMVTAVAPPVCIPLLPEVTGSEIVIGHPLNEPFLYKIITEPSLKVQRLVNLHMPHAQIMKWHPDFWEIVPKGTDKLTGVAHVLSYLNLRWDNAIVFGDSGNDLSLFKKAAYAVAIGSKCSDLVRLSTFVAPEVESNGLEWAVRKIMGIREKQNDDSNCQ